MVRYLALILICISLFSCETSKFEETSLEKFEGTWSLHGRSMFDGIEIRIEKNDKGKLVGKVSKINDNKYVNMFVEPGDIWMSEILRNSNFEFILTEKKIGSQLFSLYGLSTSMEYTVQFIDENTIGLGIDEADPLKSKILYKRVNN